MHSNRLPYARAIAGLSVLMLLIAACSDQDSTPSHTSNDAADTGNPDSGTHDVSAEPLLALAPSSGSMSGYYPVELDLTALSIEAAEITKVRVGINATYDNTAVGPQTLQVYVQGDPTPGPTDVMLETSAGEILLFEEAFTYTPPRDAHFTTVVAIGASLTQGVQAGTPTLHGALMSPPAQLARQLDAYMPLPLFKRGLFPNVTVADVGPPPTCAIPDIAEFVTAAATDVIPKLEDEQGEFGFHRARVDPEIEPYNIAVGGSRIADVLNPPSIGNFGVHFIGHMVYDPYGGVGERVVRSQLEQIEALNPTLIITSDLFGNDLIAALTSQGDIDPGLITPIPMYEATLNTLLERLSATGAAVFIANMPQPSLLPAGNEKRDRMVEQARTQAQEEGSDPDAAADAAFALANQLIAETDEIARQYNALLDTSAARWPNIHVVDMTSEVARISAEGLTIDGTAISVLKFGGLLGLDGVHFTDTGYAMVANVFIEAINTTLGTNVPSIELGPIFANDVASPQSYEDAGFDVTLCTR